MDQAMGKVLVFFVGQDDYGCASGTRLSFKKTFPSRRNCREG
jgi:hypothetical protein